LARVEAHVRVRVRDEREHEQTVLSVEQLSSRAVSTVIAGAAGAVFAAWALKGLGTLWGWLPLCAAAALLPQPLRRHDVTRLPVLAWQSGVAGAVLLAGLGGGMSLVF